MWLTPGSRWRVRYRGWPALGKLRYVHRVARAVGGTEPPVRLASTDITVEETHTAMEEHFRANQSEETPVDVALENDLPDFFRPQGHPRTKIRPAWEMVREFRLELIGKVEYWAGVRRSVVRSLVDSIEHAAERLRLYVDTRNEPVALLELTAYATTLAMNFLGRGAERRRPATPDRRRADYGDSPASRPRGVSVAVDGSLDCLTRLGQVKADPLFNLVEAFGEDDTKEPHVAAHKAYLIEANPNPYLRSAADFIRGGRASGRTHPQTILGIAEAALQAAEPPARSENLRDPQQQGHRRSRGRRDQHRRGQGPLRLPPQGPDLDAHGILHGKDGNDHSQEEPADEIDLSHCEPFSDGPPRAVTEGG